ncbi:hypothetical protein ACQP1K_23000 [Sphaerimonospora sp. CA-214678]|uniref:hypothetical protein n=1 Tax=Sphaerimonospora sp. CA-214678 TaxID=3240029 RepID=UPI003D931ACB
MKQRDQMTWDEIAEFRRNDHAPVASVIEPLRGASRDHREIGSGPGERAPA